MGIGGGVVVIFACLIVFIVFVVSLIAINMRTRTEPLWPLHMSYVGRSQPPDGEHGVEPLELYWVHVLYPVLAHALPGEHGARGEGAHGERR